MAWTVRLEDEVGRVDGEFFVVVEFGSLPKGSRFPVSSLIEGAAYYDTLLNPIQVNALIDELTLSDSEFVPVQPSLLDLARRALQAHTYLRFIGD